MPYKSRKTHVYRGIPSIPDRAIPNAVDDLRSISAEHRLVKDEDEISLITRACEVNREAITYLMSQFQIGMSEAQAEALYRYIVNRNGCP